MQKNATIPASSGVRARRQTCRHWALPLLGVILAAGVSVAIFAYRRQPAYQITWRPAAAVLSMEFAAPASRAANDYYIATNGDDAKSGSSKEPWKSFEHADQNAKPGDVIHVAPGTYSVPAVVTKASGKESARITWISDVRWGAKIVSSDSGKWGEAWHNFGDYVDLRGFDITGGGNYGLVNSGSHVRVIGNVVHDLPAPGPSGVGGAGIAHNNLKASDNDTIANVVFNIGDYREPNPRVHGIYYSNRGGYVYNNVVYRNRSWGIHAAHAASELQIYNNTVVGNGYGGIVIAPDFHDFAPQAAPGDHFVVANNIVYANGRSKGANGFGISEYASSQSLGTHNLYLGNLVYNNGPADWRLKISGGKGAQSIASDPQFVSDFDPANGTYLLKPSSPALNAAVGDVFPEADLNGGKRPVGARCDLGALEIGAPPLAWPWSSVDRSATNTAQKLK